MKEQKFIQVNSKNLNATWVAGKTEAEFVAYGRTAWKDHPEVKGKTEPQIEAWLKNIYALAKNAVGSGEVTKGEKNGGAK